MKKMISLILALVMSLILCVPVFAAEGEIPTDSASDTKIVCDVEKAESLESDITRDAKPPRQFHDLSESSYSIDGTFDTSIYTLCYFKPNSYGKIRYYVWVEWESEFTQYPLLPTMTVECWDRTTGERVTSTTFESKTDRWPFVPIIYSGDRVVSGLNTDHEYYFVFRKDIPYANASVTGTISH